MSDVTKKDWDWLLNTCTYGQLFSEASDAEMDSLRTLGQRWKQYEKEGKWKYEAHPFWCTGYTFVSLILVTRGIRSLKASCRPVDSALVGLNLRRYRS